MGLRSQARQFLTLSVFEITTVQFGFNPLGNYKVMELFIILITLLE